MKIENMIRTAIFLSLMAIAALTGEMVTKRYGGWQELGAAIDTVLRKEAWSSYVTVQGSAGIYEQPVDTRIVPPKDLLRQKIISPDGSTFEEYGYDHDCYAGGPVDREENPGGICERLYVVLGTATDGNHNGYFIELNGKPTFVKTEEARTNPNAKYIAISQWTEYLGGNVGVLKTIVTPVKVTKKK